MSVELYNLKRSLVKANRKRKTTNVTYNVIPKLKPHEEWGLRMGDTIIFNLDNEVWDLDAAGQMYEIISQSFPDNNIITLLGDNKITVLKDENNDNNNSRI